MSAPKDQIRLDGFKWGVSELARARRAEHVSVCESIEGIGHIFGVPGLV